MLSSKTSEIDKKTILSIIVPVYNVENYIDECLMSIVEQNADNLEVILVNDGSTDNSGIICEEYCKKYSYMTLYNQENQGLSMARNYGMSVASGKYVLFLDSDDYLSSDILVKLIAVLIEAREDIIIGKYLRYDEMTKEYIALDGELSRISNSCEPIEIYSEMTKKEAFWPPVSVLVIKKSFLIEKSIYFEPGIYHEDELWGVLLFLSAKEILIYNENMFYYRIGRENSITSSRNIKKEFDKIFIVKKFDRILRKTKDRNKKKVLKERMAVCIWSIVQELSCYISDIRFEELKYALKYEINYLNHGKHIWKYLLCKIFGVYRACEINIRISRWRKFLCDNEMKYENKD